MKEKMKNIYKKLKIYAIASTPGIVFGYALKTSLNELKTCFVKNRGEKNFKVKFFILTVLHIIHILLMKHLSEELVDIVVQYTGEDLVDSDDLD